MRGHGTKFGRKKEAAIAALLTQRNLEKAHRRTRPEEFGGPAFPLVGLLQGLLYGVRFHDMVTFTAVPMR